MFVGCNLSSGEALPESDSVYFRVMAFNIPKNVKRQLKHHIRDPLSYPKAKIEVQDGLFKPRRKMENDMYEKGVSIDWAVCTIPENVVKNHNTKHPESVFGVMKIEVYSIHNIEFLMQNLNCEYDPKPLNSAHSLILGFPTKEQAETLYQLEFLTLRQQMSDISEWELFPSKIIEN